MIGAALLLALVAPNASVAAPPPAIKEQPRPPAARATPPAKVSAARTANPRTPVARAAPPTKESAAGSPSDSAADAAWWQVYASGAATVIALIGTLFVVATFRQTRRTADAAFAAVEQSRRSADVAEASVTIAGDAMRRQLRAYLLSYGTSIANLGRGPVAVAVTLQNFGQTPALDVGIRARAIVTPMPLDETSLPPLLDAPAPSDIVGPGVERTLTMRLGMISPEQIRDLRAGSCAVVLYGDSTYRDVFGTQHRHSFRWFLSGAMETDMALTGDCALWIHHGGNSTT